MIIGISGKKQAGKDTIGKIIQYLTYSSKANIPMSYDDFIANYEAIYYNNDLAINGFKIKQFADPLKAILATLGVDRRLMDIEKGKESLMPYPWLDEWNDLSTGERLQRVSVGLGKESSFTIRKALQVIGTDRKRYVHNGAGTYTEGNLPNWVITDIRFPNEINAVTSRKGFIIRVIRKNKVEIKDTHKSETELDDYKFIYNVHNDGSKHDLIPKIKEILIKENII